MGMTMTQKILAQAAGLDYVEAGQLIEADLDLVLGNDITSPVAIHEMDKFEKKDVFNKEKIALVMDTLFQIKISNLLNTVSVSASLPVSMISPTILTWEPWVSNMRCFRSRV